MPISRGKEAGNLTMFTWIKEKANNKFVRLVFLSILFMIIAAFVCNVPYIKEFLGETFVQTLYPFIAAFPVYAAIFMQLKDVIVQTKSLTLQTEGLKVQMESSAAEAKRYSEERAFRIMQHLLDDLEHIKAQISQEELSYIRNLFERELPSDEEVPPSLERYLYSCFALNAFFYAYPEQQEKKLAIYQVRSFFSSEEIALLELWKERLAQKGDYRLCTLVKILTTK